MAAVKMIYSIIGVGSVFLCCLSAIIMLIGLINPKWLKFNFIRSEIVSFGIVFIMIFGILFIECVLIDEIIKNENSNSLNGVFSQNISGNNKNDERKIVANYIKQVKPLAKETIELAGKWDELRSHYGKKDLSNQECSKIISEKFISQTKDIAERMEKIEVHDSLIKVHDIGMKMFNKQYEGEVAVLTALNANDMKKLTQANRILNEARALERKYVNELKKIK